MSLQSDPKVLTFNINWQIAPVKSQILNFMLTIPSTFYRHDLFEDSEFDNQYAFKGCILFSGAHYQAMFRQFNSPEWTVYDDDRTRTKQSWGETIEFCLESNTYPTVLFFEKVEFDTMEIELSLDEIKKLLLSTKELE